ncbi:MAG: 5-formyltetrahydrofolate cyclo-ligase [Bacteroidota bacterium]
MTKQELRKIYKNKRLPANLQDTHLLIASMLEHFQQIRLPHLQYLLSFKASSAKLEVPVHFFEEYCREENREMIVCYPKADFITGTMEAYEDNNNLFWETTPFEIEQPRKGDYVFPGQIDCVLVPLLAFDQRGFRVGYGKGFYDKYLARCNPGTITIGVSFFEAESVISDTNQYDVPLTYCVTPQRLYVF